MLSAPASPLTPAQLVALLAATVKLGGRRRIDGGLLRRFRRDLTRLRRGDVQPGDEDEVVRWARTLGAFDPYPRVPQGCVCPLCPDTAIGGARVVGTWTENACDRWLFQCSRCLGRWVVGGDVRPPR